MRGYQFVCILVISMISTVFLAGCGGTVTTPPDSGEVIEKPSELPGANEPYPLKALEDKNAAESRKTDPSQKASE